MSDFLVISQARMTSTRLPGKVLRQAAGQTLLEHQIARIKRSKKIKDLVIATTVNPSDQAIVDLCQKHQVRTFRGSESDVLSRFEGALRDNPSRHCIRVTSDCPLLDPRILDHCLDQYLESGADYLSNGDAYPTGMNVEIFRSELLSVATKEAKLPFEREHVTPYFYTHPERFKVVQAKAPRTYPKYRLTVDTPEDFELIQILLERLLPEHPFFTLDDICEVLDQNPNLLDINSHVRQKKFDEAT